jgi:hypothetical protein
VQPLSSKVYRIVASNAATSKRPFVFQDNTISNGLLSVSVGGQNGAITSLNDNAGFNYAAGKGLNEYVYTGLNAASPRYVTTVSSIERVNEGPVSATLRVTADAPGCYSLVRDITYIKTSSVLTFEMSSTRLTIGRMKACDLHFRLTSAMQKRSSTCPLARCVRNVSNFPAPIRIFILSTTVYQYPVCGSKYF